MYVNLTPEQMALKEEIRAYFASVVTPEYRTLITEYKHPQRQAVYKNLIRQMGRDGWLAVGWPKEFGGKGYTPLEQLIFFEEAYLAGVLLPFVTINTVAPALMAHGSEAHRQKFLPGIAAGEIHFAIGYTEPSAGTDLAALKTTAVPDADGFVVNGQKVFTSDVDCADYVWLACRTDPKLARHKGISVLIVDTKAKGVSFTPIYTVGHQTFTTYYSDVRVPADMLVGELHGGWKLITSQLNHERIGLGAFGIRSRGCFFQTLAWAREPDETGARPIDRPWVAAALAECYQKLEAMRLLNYRMAADVTLGKMDVGLASASKVFGTETPIAVFRKLLEVVGMGGLYRRESAAAMLAAKLEEEYRLALINTFGGGVNELLRDIASQFGLGMPRATR
ncbi:MAG TPA: acyl-CoA dehydrogenase family protein [Steroidobacteraceae bacterium]|nr:acyl-CoA dehydrogenase family protein [Steroidobacteraceae bacterium]